MAITINPVQSVPKSVQLCWPKPDTRVPEAQRQKPIIEGTVDCEFVYHSQEQLEAIDAQVEDGAITAIERFRKLVPTITGLPIQPGEPQDPHVWLDQHQYGVVISNAIFQDYWLFLADDRRGNSKKRRSR